MIAGHLPPERKILAFQQPFGAQKTALIAILLNWQSRAEYAKLLGGAVRQ